MAFRFPFFGRRGDGVGSAPKKPIDLGQRASLRARFDSANSALDPKHWAAADSLSADAALSPGVRKSLRERSRYEVANNSYARGIVLTLANDIVGTGPRLQMLTDDDEFNREIESMWREWCASVDFSQKLRLVHQSRVEAGECFIALTTNPRVMHPIQMDLDIIESDRITANVGIGLDDDNEVDGVWFDNFGNPSKYRVMKYHPGDTRMSASVDEWSWYGADVMLHWYRPDRPGQSRGLPDITPALPLFSQLRRYTLAVLAAAESAADFAGILYTDAPPAGEADSIEPLDAIELESRMLMTMPAGWKLGQIKPEQPTTTYGDFKGEILNEIARCLNMPFNIAAGNSSGYNYSSGRLDHQTYYRQINVERARMEQVILDRVLTSWFAEASLELGVRQEGMEGMTTHKWFWDGAAHVDPLKEASATTERLTNLTTTLAEEFAKQGKDWEAELRQIAAERELLEELGITGAFGESEQQETQDSAGEGEGNEDSDNEDEAGTQNRSSRTRAASKARTETRQSVVETGIQNLETATQEVMNDSE